MCGEIASLEAPADALPEIRPDLFHEPRRYGGTGIEVLSVGIVIRSTSSHECVGLGNERGRQLPSVKERHGRERFPRFLLRNEQRLEILDASRVTYRAILERNPRGVGRG